MVPHISERRLVVLFMEGLLEPIRGWIKAFDPPTLREAMKKARGMEFAAPKSKSLHKEIPSKSNETPQQSDKKKEINTYDGWGDTRRVEEEKIMLLVKGAFQQRS